MTSTQVCDSFMDGKVKCFLKYPDTSDNNNDNNNNDCIERGNSRS